MKLLRLPENFDNFFEYIAIGGISFVVDVGLFLVLLALGLFRPLATSISFLSALTCHFLLNKYLNFRNFERAIKAQIRTYLIVAGFSMLLTVVIIEVLVGIFNAAPFIAKPVAIAVNIPVGYFGHKYLTFSKGIRRALKSIRGRTVE